MDILYLLIPVALIFVTVAIRFYFWAVDDGQYDDLDTESQRILFEDDAEVAQRATQSSIIDDKATKTDSSNVD